MSNKDNVQKELQELSPLLTKLKAQQRPWAVPEHYFDQLPDQVWEQIKLQPASTSQTAAWWERLQARWQTLWQPRFAIGIAAAVVIIFIGIAVLLPKQNLKTDRALVQLSAEEVTAYISQHIHEFDTELIVQATTEDDLFFWDEFQFDEAEIEQLMDELAKDLDEETLTRILQDKKG